MILQTTKLNTNIHIYLTKYLWPKVEGKNMAVHILLKLPKNRSVYIMQVNVVLLLSRSYVRA
jgi:hypothetical protein